jgi:membrane protein implicated in regulation of membrane protease activity
MSVVALKTWVGGLALVVGLVGMALEIRWLVWVAVGLLGAAFLLRFVQRPLRRN